MSEKKRGRPRGSKNKPLTTAVQTSSIRITEDTRVVTMTSENEVILNIMPDFATSIFVTGMTKDCFRSYLERALTLIGGPCAS